ncbi:MAG TPA: MFS transporter [Geminicoccaceae bacterium]
MGEQRKGGEADERRLITLVVVLTFGMNMVARGVSETFAVFLLPVQGSLGVTRSEMTGVYSVYMLVHGLGAPIMGLIFDRLGARASYGLGVLAMGSGVLGAGYVTALWQYYLCIGVLVGIGVAALGMVSASGLLSRWFTRRLGSVMGLAYAALGAGVLVLTPLTQVMLQRHDWRTVYIMLGAGILALLLPVVVLPLGRMSRGSATWNRGRAAAPGGRSGPGIAQAFRSQAFWGLFFVFFFTGFAAYAVLPQSVAYLIENGIEPLQAATAFGLTGMLSVVGMMSIGWLADRFGRRLMVTVSYLFSLTGITCIILIAWMPSLVLVYGFILFFGISQGARGPIVSTLVALLFPGGGIGSIYGVITTGLGLGAALGAWLSGLLKEMTDAYLLSFSIAWAASFAGMLQFWLVPALAGAATGSEGGRDPVPGKGG